MRKGFYIQTTTLFLLLLHVSSISAQRGPHKVELNTYIATTRKIAIAQFMGFEDTGHPLTSKYLFKIDKPLKGSFDKTEVSLPHSKGYIYDFNPGDWCILFVKEGAWVNDEVDNLDLVGIYANKQPGEDQMFRFDDFYDSTGVISHWHMEEAYKKTTTVIPNSLSEVQLKDYLTYGKYSGNVTGYLHFFSEKTQLLEPSELDIRIDYAYGKDGLEYSVSTEFNTYDFPAKPEWTMYDITYMDELIYDPNGTRPLKLGFKFLSVDSTGKNIRSKFWIDEPEEITQKELMDYLSHANYGPPYFEFELVTSNNSKYQLIQWDNIRQGMELIGFMNQTFKFNRMSPPNPEGGELEMKFGEDELVIRFKPRPEKKEQYPFIQDHFVRETKIAPVEATVTWKKNGTSKELGTCTIYYKKTGFAYDINYRSK
jgi:hypothetical protein